MRELNRFESFELFVRIAQDKYKGLGDCETFTQAITMLTERNIMPYSEYREL